MGGCRGWGGRGSSVELSKLKSESEVVHEFEDGKIGQARQSMCKGKGGGVFHLTWIPNNKIWNFNRITQLTACPFFFFFFFVKNFESSSIVPEIQSYGCKCNSDPISNVKNIAIKYFTSFYTSAIACKSMQ